MSAAFQQAVQHCWRCKKVLKACWKRVESNLNWLKLSLNIASTFLLFSKMLNGVEAVWTLHSTFVQHLPNIRSSFAERMLVRCWNRLNGPLVYLHTVKLSVKLHGVIETAQCSSFKFWVCLHGITTVPFFISLQTMNKKEGKVHEQKVECNACRIHV